MSEETAETIRARKITILKQADATANKEKQQRIQQNIAKKKAEDQYQKDLAEYNKAKELHEKELALYNKQKADIEAKEKAEAKITAEKKAKLDAISNKYGTIISDLEQQKKERFQAMHTAYWGAGGSRSRGKSRSQYNLEVSRMKQRYDQEINKNNRERKEKYYRQEFANKYSNLPLQGSYYKTFRDSGGQVSLVALYEKQRTAKEAKTYYDTQTAIQNARSDAIKSRDQHEITAREFKSQKDSYGTLVTKGQILVNKTSETVQKATKRRTQIKKSTYFAEQEKTPISIFGTTPLKSKQAEETFDNTELQQQKLFVAVTGAKDYKQAIKLRQKAMQKNPYVGTANALLDTGVLVDTSGVIIEKKLNANPLVAYEPLTKPDTKIKEIDPSVIPSFNLQKPETKTSYYLPGSLQYIYEEYKQQRTAEEIKIAGGTYGEYLKTINQQSLDNQIKLVGKGAGRAFNSYASLVGAEFQNPQVAGYSLIDLAFTDIYNSIYIPVIKPAKSTLEKLGIKVAPAPSNSKPFEQIIKAYNQRTPAENFGDILTFSTIEAGIFIGTSGLGNLAIRGASKLPYFLKVKPVTASQIIKNAKKESPLKSVEIEGIGKVKLTNFDYVEPVKNIKKKRPITSTKIGKYLAKNLPRNPIDKNIYIDTTKEAVKKTKKPRKSTLVNSKLGRLIGTNFPSTKKISDIKTRVKNAMPKEFDPIDAMQSKVIKSGLVRKAAQSKILNRPKKDKGKPPKGESGLQYEKVQRDFLNKGLPAPGKTAKEILQAKKQSLKLLQQPKPPKIPTKPKPTKQKPNDVSIVNEIILNKNRPIPNAIKNLTGQQNISGQLNKTKQNSTSKLAEKTDNILKNLEKQKSATSEKLKDKNKAKQQLKLSYDLLVSKGKQGGKGKYGQVLVNPPRYRTKTRTVVTTRSQGKGKKIPSPLRIYGISDKPNNKKLSRKRKNIVKYSTWNVDIERIGVLKGAELEVSGSTKVFKRLDDRQKKAHSKTKKNSKKKTTKKKSGRKRNRSA